MRWFESIIYGLISGISEFLPVSSQAHQVIMLKLFGLRSRDPIQDMTIHLACLVALIVGNWSLLLRLRKESRLSKRVRGMRSRQQELRGIFDLRLIRTATVPMLAGLLLYTSARSLEANILFIALFSAVNSLFLFAVERVPQGNKDARHMTTWDAILMGLCGGISALPGLSRIGVSVSLASVRGVDRRHAVNWGLLLSIPALLLFLVFDFLTIITTALDSIRFMNLLCYIASAFGAFLGAYLSVLTVKSFAVRTGFSGFAYYSFGMTLFALILYLIA